MPTDIHLASEHTDRILHDLLDQSKKEAETAAKELIKILDKYFERTFKHWNESGANKFDRPAVKHTYTIQVDTRKGISVLLNSLVVDNSGKRHVLWHWLTFGTDPYTAKKNLVFRERKKNRTHVSDLDAKPFPGWTGRWVTIPKGKTRRGIKARDWYETIAEYAEDTVQSRGGKLGTYMAWAIEDTGVKP